MLPITWTRRTWVLVLFFFVASCASQQMAHRLQEGPTTLELYRRGAANALDAGQLKSELLEPVRYENYTREAGNEIDQLFHRLPNPRILVYVYPHLATDDNAPIPGYTTAINLYAKDEYALPHEVVQYSANARRDP